jgi:hypothetical protein
MHEAHRQATGSIRWSHNTRHAVWYLCIRLREEPSFYVVLELGGSTKRKGLGLH